MAYRLPSLNSLRAFEAAARHMSFQKAAEELFVTPSALSYQIRQLEDHVEQPLFLRLNRAVKLTEAGGFETVADEVVLYEKMGANNNKEVVEAGDKSGDGDN